MTANRNQLIRRDAALAAVLGLIAANGESTFGADDYGDDYSQDYGGDYMGDDYAFSDDYFGAAPAPRLPARGPRPPARPAPRPSAWGRPQVNRGRLLRPNHGSPVDIERYSFGLSQALTIGTPLAAFTTLTGTPDTEFRPQRMSCNAPVPMFAFFSEMKVANVSYTIGSGVEDAYFYNANGVGQSLDLPTLSPANRATIRGNYTGLIPAGYDSGFATNFSLKFTGPSTLAGGRGV